MNGRGGTLDHIGGSFHNEIMTEADSSLPNYEYLGKARLLAHPGPELSQALQEFINPERLRDLGGKVLELKSEQHLILMHGAREMPDNVRRKTVTKAELSSLSHEIARRQQTIHPWVSPEVVVHQLPAPETRKHEGRGISLRFKVQVDELTKRALRTTALLDPDDGELYMRFKLHRPDMRLGGDLLAARDALVRHLRRPIPEPLDSLYMHTPDMHA